MILYSHRGNRYGPSKEENTTELIIEAINKGFSVEIDLWKIGQALYLGHDGPQYYITHKFLDDNSDKLLIHCKNFAALQHCLAYSRFHCFYHGRDEYTLTSKGIPIAYPGVNLINRSLAMKAEFFTGLSELYLHGVCSDYIERFKYLCNSE